MMLDPRVGSLIGLLVEAGLAVGDNPIIVQDEDGADYRSTTSPPRPATSPSSWPHLTWLRVPPRRTCGPSSTSTRTPRRPSTTWTTRASAARWTLPRLTTTRPGQRCSACWACERTPDGRRLHHALGGHRQGDRRRRGRYRGRADLVLQGSDQPPARGRA